MSAAAKELERVATPAFGEVYAEHFAMVWRLCANRVPASSLDDVVQEVFLVVHRKLPEFEGRSSVRTWVYGIVRRVVRDYARASHNRPLGAPLPEDLIDERELPLDALARKRALGVLDEALARMSEEQREAFLLVEVEQMTSREAAELLEASDNTIRARVRAARATFAAAVARHHARQRWGEHE
jgi:RNA polymerase sigma-70 factor (ECF subfamily)